MTDGINRGLLLGLYLRCLKQLFYIKIIGIRFSLLFYYLYENAEQNRNVVFMYLKETMNVFFFWIKIFSAIVNEI